LERLRPDVVHSYGWLTYSCAAALARKSVPLVLSIRDWGNFCALRTLLQYGEEPCSGPAPLKCLDCAGHYYGRAKGAVAVAGILGGRPRLATRAAAVHFNSAYTRRVAWQHLVDGRAGFAPGSTTDVVIPNFLTNDDGTEPDDAILARLPDHPYILFVGAFRRVKGIDQLLAAYRQLSNPPPLVMVGTRESDSPATFPPDVTVLEAVPRATVMAAWERALFGVFPSTVAETFGNVVHEAMSRGRPVIGTRPSGHEELIVDGETGLLVPRGDVDALATAMRRLIEDPAMRERAGAAARERAALFSAETAVPRFEALYQAAIESSRRALVPRGH
jgi:glycosyltransferase involved in cell wall biosynthesis